MNIQKTLLTIAAFGLFNFSGIAKADVKCFALQGQSIDMCINSDATSPLTFTKAVITFRDQMTGETLLQSSEFVLAKRGICIDCNKNFFNVVAAEGSNDSTTALLQLAVHNISPIAFNGSQNDHNYGETGTVKIGTKVFKYQSTATVKFSRSLGQRLAH